MDKRTKTVLIVGGLAVAAYLAYRWYQNRQSGGGVPQLGTNLNSVAPALIGGSTGPQSGLNYYAGSTAIYVTEQITQAAKSQKNPPGTPGGPIPGTQPMIVHKPGGWVPPTRGSGWMIQ